MGEFELSLPSSKCFVVSMTNAQDRRETFSYNAINSNVEWAFFDACTRLAPGLDYDPARSTSKFGRSLTKGEIGCYSSHYSLWQQLLEDDGADQYLIIEDDVLIDWAMVEALAKRHFAQEDIHYLRLFYKNPVPSILLERGFGSSQHCLIELYGWAWGTQAYFITKQGAQAMIQACQQILMPLDDQMDRSWEHGIPNLAIFPAPAIESAVPSQIETDRGTQRSGKNATLQFRKAEWKRSKSAYRKARLKRWWNNRSKR